MYSVVCCSFLTQKNFIIPNSLSEYSILTKSNVDDNALEYLRWKTYSICYCLHAIPLFNSFLSALEAILSHKIKTTAKYQALNKGTFSVFRSCTSFNGRIECPTHERFIEIVDERANFTLFGGWICNRKNQWTKHFTEWNEFILFHIEFFVRPFSVLEWCWKKCY